MTNAKFVKLGTRAIYLAMEAQNHIETRRRAIVKLRQQTKTKKKQKVLSLHVDTVTEACKEVAVKLQEARATLHKANAGGENAANACGRLLLRARRKSF